MGDPNAAIRAEMARNRITQTTLAEALGITQPAVSARLSGRVEWRLSELRSVAAMVEVDLADLLAAPAKASA